MTRTVIARTVIVGATGGIGSDLARRLAAAGRRLHLISRTAGTLAPLAAELSASQAVCDVTDSAALTAAIDAGAADGLDGLAYCVGSIVLKPLSATTDADFLDAVRLNALGAATAARAAAPALKAAGRAGGGAGATASILLISSVAARSGFSNHSVISLAKGAVEGLVHALAAELAPQVRVNGIAPSLVDTPLAAALTGSATMADSIARMHPIPRLGTAADVAALGAFLMSAEAGWMTGQIHAVDGGRSTLRTKG